MVIVLLVAQLLMPQADARGHPPGIPALPPFGVGFGQISGIAADRSGQVFVASSDLARVLRIGPAGVEIVAGQAAPLESGPGTAAPGVAVAPPRPLAPADAFRSRLTRPIALAVGPTGDLFVGESDPPRISRIVRDTATLIRVWDPRHAGVGIVRPSGLSVTADGRLLVADGGGHRVIAIDLRDGAVSTVAGDGMPGRAGEGRPATQARLSNPAAVAVTSGGDVLVADRGNHKVLRIAASGAISTFAGTGRPGAAIAGERADESPLRDPSAVVAAPGGGAWILDLGNRRIVFVDPAGRLAGVPVRAAGPERREVEPAAIALAGAELLVAGRDGRLYGIPWRGGDARLIAGDGGFGHTGDGGSALRAFFVEIRALAFDRRGNLYLADAAAHRVRRVDASSGVVTTLAGVGTPGSWSDGDRADRAALNEPSGLAVDGRDVYIADTGNDRILLVSPDGGISIVVGGEGSRDASGAGPRLGRPRGLAIVERAVLAVAEERSPRLRHVDLRTGALAARAQGFRFPTQVLGGRGNRLLVVDGHMRQILAVTPAGSVVPFAGYPAPGWREFRWPPVSPTLSSAIGIARLKAGELLVADAQTCQLHRVARDGRFTTISRSLSLEGQRLCGSVVGVAPDGGIHMAVGAVVYRFSPEDPRPVAVAGGGFGF